MKKILLIFIALFCAIFTYAKTPIIIENLDGRHFAFAPLFFLAGFIWLTTGTRSIWLKLAIAVCIIASTWYISHQSAYLGITFWLTGMGITLLLFADIKIAKKIHLRTLHMPISIEKVAYIKSLPFLICQFILFPISGLLFTDGIFGIALADQFKLQLFVWYTVVLIAGCIFCNGLSIFTKGIFLFFRQAMQTAQNH